MTLFAAPARQADHRDQATGRGLRRDYAMELPVRDDHAQGRCGARGGLHDGGEAGTGDTLFGAGLVESWPKARGSARCALNVVTGDAKTIGGEMTSSPIVRKLSFTGSTAVGRLLMQQCVQVRSRRSRSNWGQCTIHRV